MKKATQIISLLLLCSILLTACGEEETAAPPAEDSPVTDTADDSSDLAGSMTEAESQNDSESSQISELTEPPETSETFEWPRDDYDSWMTDEEGNELWGYYAPAGFIKNEEYSSDGMAYYASDGDTLSSVSIVCPSDTEGKWMSWYESDIPDETLFNNNSEDIFITAVANGTIETPYGIFKDYRLVDEREDYMDSEMAFLCLPDGTCVKVAFGVSKQGGSAGYSYSGSMEYLLKILTDEKPEVITIDDSYENYLFDANGDKIWGCHTLPDVSVDFIDYLMVDDPEMNHIMRMQNNQFHVSIQEDHQLLPIYVDDLSEKRITSGTVVGDGREVYFEYTYKEDVETVYGTAKLYEEYYGTELMDGMTGEVAIFYINGRCISVSYYTADADAPYNGTLKDIIENQLL